MIMLLLIAGFSPVSFAQDNGILQAAPDFLSVPAEIGFDDQVDAPKPDIIAPADGDLTDVFQQEAAPLPADSQAVKPLDNVLAPTTKNVPNNTLADVPDEYIIEAAQYADKCSSHHKLSLLYDCQCLSVQYLDKRLERGPSVPAASIENLLGRECKDGTGMAGKLYSECLGDFNNAPKHLDPEEFCSCYGNSFAEMYQDLPGRMSSKLQIAIMSKARLTCMDPAAAKRVYGRYSR